MSRTRQIRTIAIVAALLLVTVGLAPAAVTAEEPLTVDVEQGRQGSVFVSVSSNDTAVEGADVTVTTTDENATYEGENTTYETDANGTAYLPVPEADVTVEVTATDGNRTANETRTLSAPTLDVEVDQAGDGTATGTVAYAITGDPATGATVNVSTVDANDTYAGVGEYETDENGTIHLEAPEEAVKLRLDASANGVEGSAQVILQNETGAAETYENFGARISAYVQSLLGEEDGGIGRIVADFATSNNPGNAPEHAGPPGEDERGGPSAAGAQGGNSTATGSADASGNGGGPPADKGPNKGDDHPGKAKGR